MKNTRSILSSKEKALSLNLQPSIYGVFAEIGAGQEVSNHFYKAGSASGTVAKSICAYDMTLSDSIYGATKKYVSHNRLSNMLDVEYQSLINGIPSRSDSSHFFAFANTIQTTRFYRTNKGQGWLGIKFQTSPNCRPSMCKIHVILHTEDMLLQQQIIGDLGVNLIYGVYEYQNDPDSFILSLKDNIDPRILEINFIEVSGNSVSQFSSLALSLLLVKYNLTKMIMIDSNANILQPLNALYKKDVAIIRGRFNPPTKVTSVMFESAQKELSSKFNISKHKIFAAAEITLRCYKSKEELTIVDFLNRIKMMAKLGYPVMVTNFKYHHEFVNFLNDFVQLNSLNLILGLDNIGKCIRSGENKMLKLIQSLSEKSNRILAFPELGINEQILGVKDIKVEDRMHLLLKFLQTTERLVDIDIIEKEVLKIKSEHIIELLSENNESWHKMVPPEIVPVLSENRSFILHKKAV